jgi:hypothetical protein
LTILFALLLVLLAPTLADAEGPQRLYNGIVLPKEWPPQPETLPTDPVEPFYLKAPPAVIPIDVGRQLFVDDFLIESTTLERNLHLPEYYPGNPIMHGMAGSVWWDPQEKIFKAWGGYPEKGLSGFATSVDGIHWDQTGGNVTITADDSDKKVGKNIHSMVWPDYDEKDPQRRYKMIYPICFIDQKCRYWVRFSSDGYHWGKVIATHADCGDASRFFYNPFRKVWVLNMRHGWTFPRSRRYWETRDPAVGPWWNLDANQGPIVQAPLWVGADSADPVRAEIDAGSCEVYSQDVVA